MKKLTVILVMIFAISHVLLQAQIKTIHDPNLEVSVTSDLVKAMGEAVSQAEPGPVVLNFEGLSNLEEISGFYEGKTSKAGFSGMNYGITFNGPALALIDARGGGTGNFTCDPSPNTILFILSGCEAVMNVPSGFSTALYFDYTSAAGGVVSVYDGPDGTGNLLASLPLPSLSLGLKGESNAYFDKWKRSKVTFQGAARSVVFLGVANQYGIDNIILGGVDQPRSTSMAVGTGTGETGTGETSDFLTTISSGKSQTEKGKLFIAGTSRLDLSIGGEKSKYDGEVDEGSESSYFDLNFIPKAGYFFIDNLAGGIFMDVEFYSDKSKADEGTHYKSTTFIIGPFARFYIPICDKLIPFAEASVGFGVDNYKSKYSTSTEWYKSKSSVFTYRLGGGATYFFNQTVGADLFMGFQHDSYKNKDSSSGERSSDSKTIYNEFLLQLGIVVILGL